MNKVEEVQGKVMPVLVSVNAASDQLLHVRNIARSTNTEHFQNLLGIAQEKIDEARDILREAVAL